MLNAYERPSNNAVARQGRILKEIKTPLTLPAVSQQQVPPQQPRRDSINSNVGGIRPNLSADGAGGSSDCVKRRVRDLEYENQKLRAHVEQAEKSIQNYRGYLSNKTHTADSHRSIGCQTEDSVRSSFESRYSGKAGGLGGVGGLVSLGGIGGGALQQQQQQQHQQTSAELQNVKRERDDLRASVESLSSLLKLQQQQQQQTPSQSQSEPKLSNNSAAVLADASTISAAAGAGGLERTVRGDNNTSTVRISRDALQSLLRSVRAQRAELCLLKEATRTELAVVQLDLFKSSSAASKTAQQILEQAQRKSEMQDTDEDLDSGLATAGVFSTSLGGMIEEAVKFACITPKEKLVHSPAAPPIQQPNATSVAVMTTPATAKHLDHAPITVNSACSPIVVDPAAAASAATTTPVRQGAPHSYASVSVNTATPQAAATAAPVSEATATASTETSMGKSMQMQQSPAAVAPAPAPTTASVALGTSASLLKLSPLQQQQQVQQLQQQQQQEHQLHYHMSQLRDYEGKINVLTADLRAARESNRMLTSTLSRAKEYFNGIFLRKVKAEAAAAKQVAHVRDLTKVAAHREITLERDRVLNELVYKGEIEDILHFALTAAEKALGETQPSVVERLVENRTKRVKACDRQYTTRKKDLEQRSVETCLVSSSALEGFKVKAEKKFNEAEGDVKTTLSVLNDLLSVGSTVNGNGGGNAAAAATAAVCAPAIIASEGGLQ